jgi:hypothetical protein
MSASSLLNPVPTGNSTYSAQYALPSGSASLVATVALIIPVAGLKTTSSLSLTFVGPGAQTFTVLTLSAGQFSVTSANTGTLYWSVNNF